MIARIWQGRTRASVADEYLAYMYEHGVQKLRATRGNLGVQVLRRVHDGIAEFTTMSYWSSHDEIRAYAGEDIDKPRHLPRDAEYLLELPEQVKHFEILVDDPPRPAR
jgi:heme-degrading monooxygenase HmoA